MTHAQRRVILSIKMNRPVGADRVASKELILEVRRSSPTWADEEQVPFVLYSVSDDSSLKINSEAEEGTDHCTDEDLDTVLSNVLL